MPTFFFFFGITKFLHDVKGISHRLEEAMGDSKVLIEKKKIKRDEIIHFNTIHDSICCT